MFEYSYLGRNLRRALSRLPQLETRLMENPIASALRRANPKLVISVFGQFPPDLVERWREATPSATWVVWYPDAMVNLGNHRMFLAPWDRLFFKEPFLVDLLTSTTNLPTHFLPEACNPSWHRSETWSSDQERQQYACDVAVAGNLYPYRLLLLEQLPSELHLRVYGAQLPLPPRFSSVDTSHTGRFVSGRTKALAFQGAKVVLNTMHFGEIRGVNARLFEATACGGFVLTQASPELGEYFRAGSEVVTFGNAAEMREALTYYLGLSADEQRAAIATAGQRRAHADHTYHHRLRNLLSVTGVTSDPTFSAMMQ